MDALITTLAARIALCASGVFFMAGLLTGYWKYQCMKKYPKAEAPFYVNTAHRAALMYAFAAQLLAVFASLSAFSDRINCFAVGAPLLFFAISILHYVHLGLTTGSNNSLRDSSNPAMDYLILNVLSAAEIGGFGVLFAGFVMRVSS